MLTILQSCRASQRRARGQAGITLTEILITIALLGIVIAPFTTALVVVIRGNAESTNSLKRSSEAQRIGEAWTHDVQSVAADGVNEPAGETCGASTPGEVVLVTFHWDRSADAASSEKSATWVARGSGRNVELLRRVCDGSDLKELTLAKGFGVAGRPISSLINGTGGVPGGFCPADSDGIKRSCTIQVHGTLNYEVTVKRRVPDVRSSTFIQTAPAPVNQIMAFSRYQQVIVDWSPPPVAGGQSLPVTGYTVFLYSDQAGTVQVSSPVSVDGSARRRVSFEGLENGASYFVRVQARNEVGWGDYSDVYGPVVPAFETPDPATSVVAVATPNTGQVEVTWTRPSIPDGNPPFTGFAIWAFAELTPDTPNDLPLAQALGPVENVPCSTPPADPGRICGVYNLPLTSFAQYRFVVADRNGLGLSWDPVSAAAGPVANDPAISNVVMPYKEAVFVAANGSDLSLGCTVAAPCKTIGRGLTIAAAKIGWSSQTVALSAGQYDRASISATQANRLTVVRGGFPVGFSAPPGAGNTSTIIGSAVSAPGGDAAAFPWSAVYVGALANPLTMQDVQVSTGLAGASQDAAGIDIFGATAKVLLDRVTFSASSTGRSSVGVRARSVSDLDVVSSNLNSGSPKGSGGSAYGILLRSSDLDVWTSTVIAQTGSPGSTPSAAGADATALPCTGNNASSSTGGSACATSPKGGKGGNGKAGNTTGEDGAAGDQGSGAGPGGTAGAGGATPQCIVSFGSNNDGDPGGGGGAGKGGDVATKSTRALSAVGDAWVPLVGGKGGDGGAGSGGGGGGGGVHRNGGAFGLCGVGDAGGGAGAGGSGGPGGGIGGTGGGGGGGSFAIFGYDSTIRVLGTGSVLQTANGGAGGNGASGGKGSAGGKGGSGAYNNGATGGRGGGGGGAGGGAGGAGGQGGPSITVFRTGAGSLSIDLNVHTVTRGSGGAGGEGGSGGSGGEGGAGGTSGAGSQKNGSPGSAQATKVRGDVGDACRQYNGSCVS